MVKQFVPIMIPEDFRKEIQEKKGHKSYQKYLQDLMLK